MKFNNNPIISSVPYLKTLALFLKKNSNHSQLTNPPKSSDAEKLSIGTEKACQNSVNGKQQ